MAMPRWLMITLSFVGGIVGSMLTAGLLLVADAPEFVASAVGLIVGWAIFRLIVKDLPS
jgi:hypothetical protein